MKAMRGIIVVLFLVLVSTPAFAATLSHAPNHMSVTIQAGAQAAVPVTVSVYDMVSDTYTLRFLKAAEGNLPLGWITSRRTSAFLNRQSSSASTDFTIAVPAGTRPGVYSSYVYSKAVGAHDSADWGRGLLLEVIVPSEGCSEVPTLEITSLTPEVLWPPNHSMEMVMANGIMRMPEGCSFRGAKYSIEDEYGVYTREGMFVLSGVGWFSVLLPVEAWRTGQDMDGRTYRITLSAENDAGVGSSETLEVIVPHDKGRRPNAE